MEIVDNESIELNEISVEPHIPKRNIKIILPEYSEEEEVDRIVVYENQPEDENVEPEPKFEAEPEKSSSEVLVKFEPLEEQSPLAGSNFKSESESADIIRKIQDELDKNVGKLDLTKILGNHNGQIIIKNITIVL